MPVDIVKPRLGRPPRRFDEKELKEIELKRLRGEISCAECRRLKLKCDKRVPCGSCIRRGCDTICPSGFLNAGQGSRFILADTQQLHQKIAEMSFRIRQLEEALAILQATVSTEQHPLLHDDLIKIKYGSEILNPVNPVNQETAKVPPFEQASQESVDVLGTLAFCDKGECYFGSSGGTLALLLTAPDECQGVCPEIQGVQAAFPPHLSDIANLFPFTTNQNVDGAIEALETFLPSQEYAITLCESYFNYASIFFRPIKRDELFQSLLPSLYRAATERYTNTPGLDDCPLPEQSNPHSLASLFFIFGLGALMDVNLPPYNARADHYYNLGRVALSLRDVVNFPSLETVRAVGLMSAYHYNAGVKYCVDSCWVLMSFASKLAQSIGLHRDCARWNMDAQTIERRRNLFWEVFSSDVNHSLTMGRPPAIHLSYIDCEFPTDEDAVLDAAGNLQHGVWYIKHMFARDISADFAQTTLAAKPPTYAAILELDRKVRQISLPEDFLPITDPEDPKLLSPEAAVKTILTHYHRTVTMMYLHRSFFAQALLDFPTDPLKSPFAPSFLAAYRCASEFIKATAHQFKRCPELSARIWRILFHAFTAAMIVGNIVTRSPLLSLASSAWMELHLALEIFEQSAKHSKRALVALTILRRMKERAILARTQLNGGTSVPFPICCNNLEISPDRKSITPTDELAIFGGQVKYLKMIPPYPGDPRSDLGSGTSSMDAPLPMQPHSEPLLGSSEQGHANAMPSQVIHPLSTGYISSSANLLSQPQPEPPYTVGPNFDSSRPLPGPEDVVYPVHSNPPVASGWNPSPYTMQEAPPASEQWQHSSTTMEAGDFAPYNVDQVPMPSQQQRVFTMPSYNHDPITANSTVGRDPLDFLMFDGYGTVNSALTQECAADLQVGQSSHSSGMEQGWPWVLLMQENRFFSEGESGLRGETN